MVSEGDHVDPNEIVLSESAAKLASIQTVKVVKGMPQKSVYLQGKIQADERNISELTTRFGGRIEKLFVNFTGQKVREGEKLASIYSPELVSAQRELLEAIGFKESRPSLYTAARTKLKLWDLSDAQINTIESEGKPQVNFNILSPITGTVMMRHVALGDYVKEGNALFQVINLSNVWVLFDAYESDLPWIKKGDKISFTVQAIPGKNFNARVTHIDPFLNPATRVAKVRVEISNAKEQLKPEMFVTGIVASKTAKENSEILIPKTAILWTGKRAVVYVKQSNRASPSFLYREIILGPEAGTFYVVASGLSEGEEIAVNGVFKIDAAAQLEGKQSMMNPSGEVVSSGHNHGGMEMGKQEQEVEREHANHKMEANIEHAMFNVSGNCEMCKTTIEKAAGELDGVNVANWEMDTKQMHVSFNKEKVSMAKIHKAIAAAGYDTDKETASKEVYENLPECCKYTR